MNKNSLFAFVLIAIAVIFFNSAGWNNFWYGTILKKPVPQPMTRQQKTAPPAPVPAGQSQGEDAKDLKDSGDAKGALRDQVMAPSSNNNADSINVAPDSLSSTDSTAAMTAAPSPVERIVTVETNRLIAAVSTKGGRIVSVKMKDYRYTGGARKGQMIDLLPLGSVGGAQLSINDESFDMKPFNLTDSLLINDSSTDTINVQITSADGYWLTLETTSFDGKPLQKIFTFNDDTYRIGYTVRSAGLAGRKVITGWAGGVEDSEAEAAQNLPFAQGLDKRRAHYSDGRKVNHFEMKKKGAEEPSGMFRWVAMSSKYFFVALVADKVSDADIRVEGRDVTPKLAMHQKKPMLEIDYSIYYKAEAEASVAESWIYAGPGKISELSSHGLKFEKSLFPVLSWARHIFWADAWFPPLAEIILRVLQFLFGLVKDYGIAIFFLTLLSKVITFPLTQSSAKSMLRMKELQPKLMALKQKHKGNPQKMNEEMMALYKTEGVNPFNPGCLPMFLQMPIFIALFVVLRKAVELRGASSFLLPWVKDLSLPEALFYLPGNGLPFYGNNVALMPIIMAALTFFQQKQVITDPNQKMMIYLMPVIMLVMFNSFPAGVVFYWTVSSALGLVQQKWMKPKITPATATATVTVAGGGTQKVPVKKKASGGGAPASGRRGRK